MTDIQSTRMETEGFVHSTYTSFFPRLNCTFLHPIYLFTLRLLLKAVSSVTANSKRIPLKVLANFHHSIKLGWWDNPASGVCCDRREAWAQLSSCQVSGEASAIDFVNFSDPYPTWLQHSDFAFEVKTREKHATISVLIFLFIC